MVLQNHLGHRSGQPDTRQHAGTDSRMFSESIHAAGTAFALLRNAHLGNGDLSNVVERRSTLDSLNHVVGHVELLGNRGGNVCHTPVMPGRATVIVLQYHLDRISSVAEAPVEICSESVASRHIKSIHDDSMECGHVETIEGLGIYIPNLSGAPRFEADRLGDLAVRRVAQHQVSSNHILKIIGMHVTEDA